MKIPKKELTGIILAGGRSQRMGKDKGLMLYQGKPMIQYSIELLLKYCDKILISANDRNYESFGYPVIEDLYMNRGPMSGLLSCLQHSNTHLNICMPCDVPAMKPQILEKLIDSSDKDHCVVPLTPLIEPLIAIYPSTVITVLNSLLNSGVNKMTEIYKIFPVHFVTFDNKLDSLEISSFNNINTPDDLVG